MPPTTGACIARMRAGRKPTGENQMKNLVPNLNERQYSSGSRTVVEERSHSVMIQKRTPLSAV